ncbi:MAG: fatty acid desaturase [Streptosporangiaceae bacterium]
MPVSESVAPVSGPEASTAGAALADPQYEGQPVTVVGGPASPPASGARDWLSVLSLGFGIDRNGNRRSPIWTNIVFLGILLPGFALWGLYRAFATPTSVGLWVLAAALYLFTLFGVTLGNHRYWTHRGYEMKFPLQVVLAVASGMSLEGDIQQWVLNHRAHHRFADEVGKDPHSPYEYSQWHGYKGLAWAQGIWLFFGYKRPPGYEVHRDLAADRLVQWQRRAFAFLAIGNFLVPLAFYPLYGWNAVLIAGALRTAALMTATGFVNSVCHKWGSRAKDSRGLEYRADDSRNNSFVAVVAGGEGNHSWHHADPACPRHGRKVALDAAASAAGARPDRGWRPDATWRLIQFFAALGLIYKLRPPRPEVCFADKQLTPSPSLQETHREWHVADPDETHELVPL